MATAVIPELDYPLAEKGHANIGEFGSPVMAGLDTAIQSQSEAPCSFWMAASGAAMTMEFARASLGRDDELRSEQRPGCPLARPAEFA
jgi:hypothetical protein